MDVSTSQQMGGPHRPAGEAPGILGDGGIPSAVRRLPPTADDTERTRKNSGCSRRSDTKGEAHSRRPFSQSNRAYSTRNVPCRYFRERRCLRGDACPFSHDQTTDSPSSVSRAPLGASSSGTAQSFRVSAPSENSGHHHGRGGLPQNGHVRGGNRAQQSRYGGSSLSLLSTSRPAEANSAVDEGTSQPKNEEREMTEEETTASETLPGESIPQDSQAGAREDRQVRTATVTPSASSRRRRESFRQRGSSSSASTSGFSRQGGRKPSAGGWTYRPVQNSKENGGTYQARDDPTEMHGVQPDSLAGKGAAASASGSGSLLAPPPQPPRGLYAHSGGPRGRAERVSPSSSSHKNRVPAYEVSSQRDRERRSEDGGTTGASSSSTSSASSSSIRRRGGPFPSNNRPPCLPPGLANPSQAGDVLTRWTWRDEYVKLKLLYASSFLRLYGCDYSSTNSAGGQQSSSHTPTTTATVSLVSGTQSIPAVSTSTTKREEGTPETRQHGEGEQKEKHTDTGISLADHTTPTSEEAPVDVNATQEKQDEKAGNHLNERAEGKALSDVEGSKNCDVVSVIRFTHNPTDPDFDATLFLPNGLLMEVTVTRAYPGFQMLQEMEEKEKRAHQMPALSLQPQKGQEQREEEPKNDSKNDIRQHSSVDTPQAYVRPGEDNGSKAKKLVLGASLKICNIELSTFLLETIPKVFDEFLEKNSTEPFVIFKALKFVDRHLSSVFALSRMVGNGGGGTPVQLSAPQFSPDSGSKPHQFTSPDVEKAEKRDGAGQEKSEEDADHPEDDKKREWTDEEQRK